MSDGLGSGTPDHDAPAPGQVAPPPWQPTAPANQPPAPPGPHPPQPGPHPPQPWSGPPGGAPPGGYQQSQGWYGGSNVDITARPAVPHGPPRSKKVQLFIGIGAMCIVGIVLGVVLSLGGTANTPKGVATAFINSLLSGNYGAACNYVEPSEQKGCSYVFLLFGGLSKDKPAFSGTATAANDMVVGNRALVAVTGTICTLQSTNGQSHQQCNSNSNPNAGLPSSPAGFAAAFARATSSSSSSTGSPTNDAIPCEELSGQWYVYLGSL